jgi:hypothetical protein
MSTIKTTNITHGSNSGTANMVLASDGKVTIPEKKLYCPGAIVQVVQYIKSDTWTGGTSFADITGVSQAITPTASSSKVLIRYVMNFGKDNQSPTQTLLQRDIGGAGYGNIQATALGCTTYNYNGDADENHQCIPHFYEYLDSPNTASAVTYKIQAKIGAGNVYLNRRGGAATVLNTSYITLMEVAG